MRKFIFAAVMLSACTTTPIEPLLHPVEQDPCDILEPDQPCCEYWLGCQAPGPAGPQNCYLRPGLEGVGVCRLTDGTVVKVPI